MKFRIIWIGSTAGTEFRQASVRYIERIRHFFPLEITEVAPEKGRQSKSDAAIIRADSARLAAALPDRGTIVALDERGKPMDSLKFARWLEELTIRDPWGVSFIVGGDLGLDDQIRKRAHMMLSLSAMTLPHDLVRVILLEQIYRACTLMRNIRYHK
jgi:23S rRNA (pseudouridine1915-N3)-methyltransferase